MSGAKCPKCGEWNDLWESFHRNEEAVERECDACEAPLLALRHVTVDYELRNREPAAKHGDARGE